MTVNLDRMRYLVVSDHEEGPIIWEVQLHRMDRATVAEDIKHGQYGDVLLVIEFNTVEGTSRDATEEFETPKAD